MNQEYLRNVNKPFDHEIVAKLKQQAKVDQIPIMTDEGIHFLIQLIKIHNAKKVLEIGTAIGYSSILMALFTNAEVTSIERNETLFKQANSNIEFANQSNKIRLLLGDANDVIIDDDDYDIIFIDAAKSSYIRFFEKFSKNLKTGGLIVSDNLLFRGMVAHPEDIESRNRKQLVKKINHYNEFIVNHPDFDSYIYDIGDGLSISIKK
ncbi:MAG: O-methyltransferase [Tenericutes bacterium]|jgi:predicted O-methyltransferase YrrM|nr:O-methyltransferase [Mycoplasmatota bacterium]